MLNIPRVAQYARFSSDNQRSESIDAQIRAMNQFCKQNHWQIVSTYTDEAKSATTDNRPQFQQMIEDSSKGLFDIVLVHKLDRFSRDRYDSAIYKKRLKKNNVTLCSVLERMDDSPESIMMESVLEGMAEYYSKNLGREVMKGMNETALQCKHTGGITPLGYDLDENQHMIINEHEAEAVKIIFQMFADGHGYSAIINYLNEHGYTTKRGRIFGKNSLYEILNNEKYTGVFVFNRAAAKSDSRRNNHAYKTQYHSKEFYLLTGKVFCGVCGKRIQGNLRFSGEHKNRLSTYRCDEPRKVCNNKENNKDYLDAYVADLLRQKIFNKATLKRRINTVNKYIATFNAEFDEHHNSIKNEIDEVIKALSNITDAVEKGVLTDALIQRSEVLEQHRNELQTQLVSLKRFEPLQLENFLHLIDKYRSLERNTPEFKTFVQTYIDKIVTYPYHIEITFDVGFGITNELKETITIKRGDLYALFESRTED